MESNTPPTPMKRKKEAILEPAILLVEEALREGGKPLRVTDMAEACFMSTSHFRRLFTERMKESPVEYLLRRKMEKAAELLCESDLPVLEISWFCGCRNHSTFFREFVSFYGCNPTEYREKHVLEEK